MSTSIKRIFLVRTLRNVLFAATASHADAQQPTKIPRIGYLIGGTNSARNEAFRQGLRELGYAEGKNIIIVEARYTDARPERLADITAELVSRKVDIIVAGGDSLSELHRKLPRPFRSS